MLESLFSSVTQNGMGVGSFLLCTAASLVFGIAIAAVYRFHNAASKSFFITLSLLPAMVQIVIMMVNGNLGAGVAVMGAFSLVRFRSVPGTAREIAAIFFAMAVGLATGMGYLFYAFLFLLVVGGAMLLLSVAPIARRAEGERELKVVIPETLDYEGIFDDLFEQYTDNAELVRVKTTNMGSLYELDYRIRLKNSTVPKAFLDALRCRNGNLNIVCGRIPENREEL